MWSFPLPSQGIGGVSATDEFVVVSSRDRSDRSDLFFVLDSLTGALICKHEIRAEGKLDYGNSPRANAVIGEELIFLLSAFGKLVALDPTENSIVWTKHLVTDLHGEIPTWGYCSSPLLVEDRLIVQPGGNVNSIVALDMHTGEVQWRSENLAAAYGSPILFPSRSNNKGLMKLIVTGAKAIRGLELASGKQEWEIKPEVGGDFMVPTPLIVADKLAMTSENNGARLYSFENETPRLVSQSDRLSGDTHSPVCVDKYLIGIDQELVSMDSSQDLREVASFSDEALNQYTTLIKEANRLLVCCSNGLVIGIQVGEEGSLNEFARVVTHTEQTPMMAQPALVDGILYVRHSDKLTAYQLSTSEGD